MKLLMLQNIADAQGGISNVNCSLATMFLAHGHEVAIFSLRNGGDNHKIAYPRECTLEVINSDVLWDPPTGDKIRQNIRSHHFLKALRQFFARISYPRQLKKDYTKMKERIQAYAPDAIINSHYELLDAIPDAYLKRTFNHYHTTFEQVRSHAHQLQIFEKYREKLHTFVWLSEATCQEAIAHGFRNSTYIYNPNRFTYEHQSAAGKHKRAVFMGRFSPEKRLPLLIDLFDQTITNYHINDWDLDIYGYGTLDEQCRSKIAAHPHIVLKGSVTHPEDVLPSYGLMMMTSSFEGFALSILEANECGVPCIVFRFSEAIEEEIEHGRSGVIIPQDDQDAYCEYLAKMMKNDELRGNMGAYAKRYVQKFHEETIFAAWMKLFSAPASSNEKRLI